MTVVPSILLNNGVEIPQLGFGTYQIRPAETKEATLTALRVGYRHIDTAEMYGNEKQVGEAVRASGLPRDEIFVTSKLNNGFHAYDDALKAFDRTMEDFGFDVLDLFLIHWPMPAVGDFVETWRAMEEIHRSGRARAIGVSNFQIHHLRRLLEETETVPAVNQIEVHPYLTQDEVRDFDVEQGIVTQAWSPLARGKVLHDPVIQRIAAGHRKTPAQVTLRWQLQRGDVVFPKSITPERVRENFDLFDFVLSGPEMAEISALDRDERVGPHPDEFNRIL
ncbi:aldo/keto reductase [Rhizohabitans arisaemae]|uniref:aldo/keto reductase n=1 Tax=Rhizohabitans arisaemae TaxID=2720610 RepID=UPI0024B21E2E|nr:aldo/keto reductase [Rhizohabitans arisaemae]